MDNLWEKLTDDNLLTFYLQELNTPENEKLEFNKAIHLKGWLYDASNL